MTFIFASLPYLAIRKIVTPDSYVTLSRYLLNSFAMFKSREIYHKYCLTILLNHDTSGHLARIHSSTFLSHYNILCCHTTFKNKWDPVTLPFSQNSWNVLFFLFGMETIALTQNCSDILSLCCTFTIHDAWEKQSCSSYWRWEGILNMMTSPEY